jgi:hypothetical protein
MEEPVGARSAISASSAAESGRASLTPLRKKPAGADLEAAQAFWKASLKVPPIAITSPTDFIWVPSSEGAGELLEGEARDLHDHVVDGRLEGRRRHAGDVVLDLVERVADGELARRSSRSGSRSPSRRGPRSARRAGSSR